MGLFWRPVKSTEPKSVTEDSQEEQKKKIVRKITVTYVDKTIPPEVFNDVDDVNYEDIWVRIRLKNKRLVIISNTHILRMDNEWETKQA
jgi:hypothetical protein